MSTTQQPEALDLANWLDAVGNGGISSTAAAAELRRQHAECEALRAAAQAVIDRWDTPLWKDAPATAGYIAALREALEADRAMRAAQPAGAQQPGAAYAALSDADRDYIRKVVAVAVTMLFDGYKEDVMRVFSTSELSEFVTITAAMRGEQVEDIYRRAWDLLSLPASASHGQAPAQAAPAAVAGPVVNRATVIEWLDANDIEVTDRQMDGLFHSAAPTAQPAVDALAEAEYFIDNPSAWSNFDQRASDAIAEVCKAFRAARAPADSVTAPAAGAVAGPGWKLVPVEPTPEMLRAGDQKTWVLPALDCWRAMLAAAPTPAAKLVGPDGRITDAVRSMIEGMSVSVDVSTGDHDAGHRYFGTVTEVMDDTSDKHGVTLLVQDAEPNFAPTPPTQAAGSVLEDAARAGFFLQLPQRPKPEAPAGTVGLDWDAYSGAQMLTYGRDCSNAAIVAAQKPGGL